ncbi:hypothetical protein UB32_01275 [Mesobacillus subterraneus]|uniref:Uncharacterized protein n=2 Tax=Mesobacillus TaxID=2675231 RepID=A0A0D6ZGM9_9BACI|nr:hypothetical protein UB32_01275 [Mesobacillus subterraneus]
MQHDDINKNEIMIEKIDNVNEGVWQILFQEKLNGKWVSGGNGNYFLEIKKDSNGNLKADFTEYKK